MYGSTIKEHRKIRHLSQVDVSKATKIPQTTISWIESNEGLPNIQQCVLLADFYGITLDELIGREVTYSESNNTYTQNNIHGNNVMNIKK